MFFRIWGRGSPTWHLLVLAASSGFKVCNVRRIRLLQASVESEDKLREMEEGSVWFDIYSGCCIMVNESPSPTVSRGFPNALSGPDARLQ